MSDSSKEMTIMSKMSEMTKMFEEKRKEKNCQPAASDTPDLIQTECVTDSRLACPNKEYIKRNIQTKLNLKNLDGKWPNGA